MSYKVIPEEVMEESAALATEIGESDNSFSRMLIAAQEFKEAGMTPIFLLDSRKMDVIVVAKETFGKRLH